MTQLPPAAVVNVTVTPLTVQAPVAVNVTAPPGAEALRVPVQPKYAAVLVVLQVMVCANFPPALTAAATWAAVGLATGVTVEMAKVGLANVCAAAAVATEVLAVVSVVKAVAAIATGVITPAVDTVDLGTAATKLSKRASAELPVAAVAPKRARRPP